MQKFAFIVHPLTVQDIIRKYGVVGKLPASVTEAVLRFVPPFQVSTIEGLHSTHGEAHGWFIGCPLTSAQMVQLPLPLVYKRIVQAGRLAVKLGAKIVGLGAFTSVVGDGGVTIARHLPIAVTSGNSYTVATALEGTKRAATLMGKNFHDSNITVLGATGSIGSACAQVLAGEVKYLTLAARNEGKLERIAEKIFHEYGLAVRVTANTKVALQNADIVLAVTSAVDTVIDVQALKPGAVVCDVSRPRAVSQQVAKERNDVLVIEGGVVEVPGDIDFGFDFGFPARTCYACMAETMILALEGRYENFSLGRDLTVKQIHTISRLAGKHGFKLAGLRSFERALSDVEIQTIKNNVRTVTQTDRRIG